MQDAISRESMIAGVDEAGRGPLAGPVIAAAVILDPRHSIAGLADSKKLTAKYREHLFNEIRCHALAWSVARATVIEIDAINIFLGCLSFTFLKSSSHWFNVLSEINSIFSKPTMSPF